MFSRVKKHLTPPTFIALIALVFAVTGGAFAATGNGGGGAPAKATASVDHNTVAASVAHNTVAATAAKKKTKAPARGPAGPRGATGSGRPARGTGPAGGTGPQGNPGGAGEKGANGNNGVSPEGTEFPEGTNKGTCTKKQGGVEFKGANTTYACNGKNGTTGFTKTLPKGDTEQGTWSVVTDTDYLGAISGFTAISFVIPLAAALPEPNVHYLREEEGGTRDSPGTAR